MTHSIQQDIENGITNGANILAARKGKIFYLESLGKSDIETGRKTQISDVYFLMSLSKTIAAITILKAIEKVILHLTLKFLVYFLNLVQRERKYRCISIINTSSELST